jgi:hypothetical protein
MVMMIVAMVVSMVVIMMTMVMMVMMSFFFVIIQYLYCGVKDLVLFPSDVHYLSNRKLWIASFNMSAHC